MHGCHHVSICLLLSRQRLFDSLDHSERSTEKKVYLTINERLAVSIDPVLGQRLVPNAN